MIASKIMVRNPHTCGPDEQMKTVIQRMRKQGLRMLPVVDGAGSVKGVFSTFSALGHIVPDYIVSGDLDAISYAPDIGLLRKHYQADCQRHVSEMMDTLFLAVTPDQSLFSVAASLVGFGKHEYAMVVDDCGCLQGLISAGDMLKSLMDSTDGDLSADA
ncbi:MAG: CBS domain-containing protein [Mariprofundus sp.]